MYNTFLKRIIDILIALSGIIILSPIICILTLILLFTNEGKPFFFQKRPGKNEEIFEIMKFKSMSDKRDSNNKLLPDTERKTKIGAFIRKYSLDEIPQLFNILKGDMSLIGPRPLMPRYLPYYTKEESIRHTVRPGVTGLAQISGRNLLSWDKKLEMDVKYVKNMSFLLDMEIFFKTFLKVLNSSNIDIAPDMLDLDTERKNG